MKYSDLYAKVAETTSTKPAAAKTTLDAALETIAATLEAGDFIDLPGIGKLVVADRAARKARNPATGVEMDVAASKAVSFKASTVLKKRLNPKA